MNYFLAMQNTYDEVQVGLFSFEPKLIDSASVSKIKASSELIPLIDTLLKKHALKLTDFPFLAINQGPGPFTTLRVVITTANGLSFATHIPLIGVDALEAAYVEWKDNTYPVTIIMFNAFAFDVYVAIERDGTLIFKGYKNIDQLLDELKSEQKSIRFIGNGAELYHEKIKSTLGDRAFIPASNPAYCSLAQIGKMGYAQWHAGDKGVQQLLPLYLKKYLVQQSG